jgi:hypothetical protein
MTEDQPSAQPIPIRHKVKCDAVICRHGFNSVCSLEEHELTGFKEGGVDVQSSDSEPLVNDARPVLMGKVCPVWRRCKSQVGLYVLAVYSAPTGVSIDQGSA